MLEIHSSMILDLTEMRNNDYPVTVNEWMKKIKSPTSYRVLPPTVRMRPRHVAYTSLFIAAVFILLVYAIIPRQLKAQPCRDADNYPANARMFYDSTYPLTKPTKSGDYIVYKIAAITDLDESSKHKDKANTWFSFYKVGYLSITQTQPINVAINWHTTDTLYSTLSQKGRGMELSELVVFNGKLYTVDDRTGIVYRLSNKSVVPWVVLPDGDGSKSKGFKCEWASVKDQHLYVGGLGKEWTTGDGVIQTLDPQWVKSIGVNGDVMHLDWSANYNALRHAAGIDYPGYMIHESAVWSDVHKRWYFLPRRASKLRYNEKLDERRATNLLISCDDNFGDIHILNIGKHNPTHGFSSFKFIPGTNDEIIVALKSEEDGSQKASYVMVFNIDGSVLLDEQFVGEYKYEGIEFV